MTLDGDHLAICGKIAVCIAISDQALARRVASLLAGDGRFSVDVDLNDTYDVILTDHAAPSPHPVIIIDGGDRGGRGVGDADVRAILPRTVDGDLLRSAVIIVAAGFTISDADGQRGLADEVSGPARSPIIDDGELTLTARENEVLNLLAHGASNKVIARALKISVHTAKFHVASVLAKLGARNRSDAVVIGIRHGFILV